MNETWQPDYAQQQPQAPQPAHAPQHAYPPQSQQQAQPQAQHQPQHAYTPQPQAPQPAHAPQPAYPPQTQQQVQPAYAPQPAHASQPAYPPQSQQQVQPAYAPQPQSPQPAYTPQPAHSPLQQPQAPQPQPQAQPAYAPQPQPHPQPTHQAGKRIPSGWGKLWAAFGLGFAVFLLSLLAQVAAGLSIYTLDADYNAALAVVELFGGLVALGAMAILGGKEAIRPTTKGLGTAFKAAIWLFIVDGFFVLIEIGSIVLGVQPIEIASNWPVRIVVLVFMCLGVGLYEEGLVRGILLNGLLARFGRTKAGVFGAVIFSSFVFGMMHWDPFIDFSDPLQLAQNCMKVLQTGMCGYLFAAIFIKVRNIWAPALIHGANDFMLMFIEVGLTETNLETVYVETGEAGAEVLTLYLILCVLYIPLVVVATKLINRNSPWRGAFWRYDPEPPAPTSGEGGIPMAVQPGIGAMPQHMQAAPGSWQANGYQQYPRSQGSPGAYPGGGYPQAPSGYPAPANPAPGYPAPGYQAPGTPASGYPPPGNYQPSPSAHPAPAAQQPAPAAGQPAPGATQTPSPTHPAPTPENPYDRI